MFNSISDSVVGSNSDLVIDPSVNALVESVFSSLGYALWIPVLSLIIPFVVVCIIIYIKSKEKRAQDRLRTEIYLKALEVGKELPDNFLLHNSKKKDTSLRNGIILLFLGIGIICMGIIDRSGETVSLGMIPLLLGVGFLIIHKINKKQQPKDEE